MERTGPANHQGWVRLRRSDGLVRLELGGEVDALMEQALEHAVTEARTGDLPVEVDTRSVTFMDSLALTSLARLAVGHHTAVFVDPPDLVRFLLDVTRLGEVVQIRETGTGADATAST